MRDYGAIGDGAQDDGPALRRVFAAASREAAPSSIHFEPGKVYSLASPSEAQGRLLLFEARGVTVEGHGATLRVRPHNRALGVYRSRDIVVRDLTIDYSPLPYVQGTILRIDNRAGWLEFRPHPGYEAPVEGDSSLYVDGRNEDCVTFDHTTRKFYHAHSRISGVRAVGDGVFRVSYRERRFTAARVGDFFAMKHRWGNRTPFRLAVDAPADPSRRGEAISEADPSLSLVHSDRVRIENIRSLAAPGMTLNARGCRALVIRGLVLERTGERLVAGCSDGIHIKGTESAPVIEDCRIEGTMDDAIHVKISGDRVTEVASPRRLRIRHMDIVTDNTNLGAGRRVLVWHPEGKRSRALTRIARYEPIDCRQGWVTLETDVPGLQTGDALYLMSEGEARIERCRFGTQLQRAILTHQSTLIRDCEISDNGQGVVVGFGDIEGPPTQAIRVENCTFRDLQLRAISVACPSQAYDQGGDPQCLVRGNRFFLARGVPAVQVRQSRGVALLDNRVYTAEPLPSPAACFVLMNSVLREDRGNQVLLRP